MRGQLYSYSIFRTPSGNICTLKYADTHWLSDLVPRCTRTASLLSGMEDSAVQFERCGGPLNFFATINYGGIQLEKGRSR